MGGPPMGPGGTPSQAQQLAIQVRFRVASHFALDLFPSRLVRLADPHVLSRPPLSAFNSVLSLPTSFEK